MQGVEISQKLDELIDKLNNFNRANKAIDEKMEKIEAVMSIMAKHIEILEDRNTKFIDKFKFGRFKFKKLSEELPSVKIKKRANFSLNDD
ncbi:hypothetical protein LMG7974_01614 [Campylobacter majalis]|uniref:Uncharacterized protein n=1 Tax=Campylobacter majalis TaxID=2790656 RepID=A0ABM8Q982_9BACT|nr:hypothetical protein [Campylobacter majalis]CAD7289537.1 hypothetical protein LMG7974_01614 [Campylobacter majalis]